MENQPGDLESSSVEAATGKKTARFEIDGSSGTAKNNGNSHEIVPAAQQGDPDIANNKPTEKKSSHIPVRFRKAASKIIRANKVSEQLSSQPTLSRKRNEAVVEALSGLSFIVQKRDGEEMKLEEVEQKFDSLAENGRLPSNKFAVCIGMQRTDEKFGEKLFKILAKKNNIKTDSISKDELRNFWRQISDDRVQIFFEMMDENADGIISKEEVTKMIKLSATTIKYPEIAERADEFAEILMNALDPKNRGYVEVDVLLKRIGKESSHERHPKGNCLTDGRWFKMPIWLVRDNWRRVWVLLLWLSAVVSLFVWKFLQYRNKAIFQIMGYCVCVAKGGAEILKLNMALILLPVCRNTITWLQNKSGLEIVVPFDDNINFHMVVAGGVVVGVILHAVTHLACDFPRLLHATPAQYEPVKKYFGEKQPPNYAWFLKGVEGITGIIMVVLMAIAFTLALPYFRRNKIKDDYKKCKENKAKKKGDGKKVNTKLPEPIDKVIGYNAFWYSHHIFIIVYTLLIIHGYYLYLTKKWYQKTTWMYLAVPMTLYAVERLTRAIRSTIKSVKVLEHSRVYEKGEEAVLALRMQKPSGFKHKSGQYMFVKCSDISHLQWHPFSISSAPGDEFLSVHIKGAGDWTKEIISLFKRRNSHGDGQQSTPVNKFPKILIDGPYGAPAQDYTKYEVVVLIGLGIGVTPMISIVREIMHKSKKKETEDGAKDIAMENGSAGPLTAKKKKEFKTKKAYFFWVTKQDKDSSIWFEETEREFKDMDDKGLVEMQYYCTNFFGDARAAPIALVKDIVHATKGVDVIFNKPVRYHFGRPTWSKIFNKVAERNPGKRVGVFYCGPGAEKAKEATVELYHEKDIKFDFHKENF